MVVSERPSYVIRVTDRIAYAGESGFFYPYYFLIASCARGFSASIRSFADVDVVVIYNTHARAHVANRNDIVYYYYTMMVRFVMFRVVYHYYNRRIICVPYASFKDDLRPDDRRFSFVYCSKLQSKCQIRREKRANGVPHTKICARNVRDKVFRSLNAKERIPYNIDTYFKTPI